MRSWNYKHANKNFKPKVWTNSVLLEKGLLEIFEALKTIENRSRSQILERLIIFFIETEKGQSDETAWRKSQRAYKRTLVNKTEKNKLKRKQLERIRKNQKKKELQAIANLAFSYFKSTQAEIPNIFSVWDECFSSARNYKNPMSKTNLDFLYTT